MIYIIREVFHFGKLLSGLYAFVAHVFLNLRLKTIFFREKKTCFSFLRTKLCKETDDNFSFKLSLRASIMARCGLWAYGGGMTSS